MGHTVSVTSNGTRKWNATSVDNITNVPRQWSRDHQRNKGGEMTDRVVPMIHVPDVRATVDWYKGIGFTVIDTYGDGSESLSFAILSFGSSEIMFNQGGKPSDTHRREVDLYIYTDNVDELYQRLKDRVEVVE